MNHIPKNRVICVFQKKLKTNLVLNILKKKKQTKIECTK